MAISAFAQYQGGSSFTVFSAQGSNPAVNCKISGKTVQKVYDKFVKGYVYNCGGGMSSKIQFPKDDIKSGLQLVQPYLVLQIYVPKGQHFSFELRATDTQNTRRKLYFSTSFSELKCTPLHCQIPLTMILRNTWTSLALHVPDLFNSCFRVLSFRCLDVIVLGPVCKLRKVFTMRNRLAQSIMEAKENEELLPVEHSFAAGVDAAIQVIDTEKVQNLAGLSATAEGKQSLSGPGAVIGKKLCPKKPDKNVNVAFGSRMPLPMPTVRIDTNLPHDVDTASIRDAMTPYSMRTTDSQSSRIPTFSPLPSRSSEKRPDINRLNPNGVVSRLAAEMPGETNMFSPQGTRHAIETKPPEITIVNPVSAFEKYPEHNLANTNGRGPRAVYEKQQEINTNGRVRSGPESQPEVVVTSTNVRGSRPAIEKQPALNHVSANVVGSSSAIEKRLAEIEIGNINDRASRPAPDKKAEVNKAIPNDLVWNNTSFSVQEEHHEDNSDTDHGFLGKCPELTSKHGQKLQKLSRRAKDDKIFRRSRAQKEHPSFKKTKELEGSPPGSPPSGWDNNANDNFFFDHLHNGDVSEFITSDALPDRYKNIPKEYQVHSEFDDLLSPTLRDSITLDAKDSNNAMDQGVHSIIVPEQPLDVKASQEFHVHINSDHKLAEAEEPPACNMLNTVDRLVKENTKSYNESSVAPACAHKQNAVAASTDDIWIVHEEEGFGESSAATFDTIKEEGNTEVSCTNLTKPDKINSSSDVRPEAAVSPIPLKSASRTVAFEVVPKNYVGKNMTSAVKEFKPPPSDIKGKSENIDRQAPEGGQKDKELDLLYDPILDCYYDPKTNRYYELK